MNIMVKIASLLAVVSHFPLLTYDQDKTIVNLLFQDPNVNGLYPITPYVSDQKNSPTAHTAIQSSSKISSTL
ncbi:hypothetical protein E5676_scaffold306G002990 [Cucumis melo var. makuwa]|uniref:Uncharacterized protein n=1 Tax=Cucumis melo var. makuwa TaxID=1194695 RepID=A0A5D3D2S5_CUCMM|nr:hypothetical protein E5676_scaffold306G002990 [Cucumis melo var. makuwa]